MKIIVLSILLLIVQPAKTDLIGKWIWCKNIYPDGTTISRNHCPEIAFYDNGKGNLDKYVDFNWKEENGKIYLSFVSIKVEKEYSFTQQTELKIKLFEEKNGEKIITVTNSKNIDLIWNKIE